MRAALLFALAGLALIGAFALRLAPRQPDNAALIEPWMRRLDADGDGLIQPAEFSRGARHPNDFGLFDLDQSNTLDLAELELLLTVVNPAWAEVPPS